MADNRRYYGDDGRAPRPPVKRGKKKKTPFFRGLANLLRYILIALGRGVYKFFLLEDSRPDRRETQARSASPRDRAPARQRDASRGTTRVRAASAGQERSGKAVRRTSPPAGKKPVRKKNSPKIFKAAESFAGRLGDTFDSVGKKITGKVNARSRKRDKAARIIVTSFAVAFVLFALFQAGKYLFGGVRVETAQSVTISECIDVTGIAVRDEHIIQSDERGVIVSAVENGSRVSNGQAIANVYISQDAAQASARLRDIEDTLAGFENLSTAGEDSAAELSSLEKQLGERLLRVSRGMYSGDIKDACSNREDILYLLSKSQIATKSIDNFDDRVGELKAEQERLLEEYDYEPRSIVSDMSGYFINEVDGYEEMLGTDILPTITPERMDEILSQYNEPQGSEIIGKIAGDYVWYIVCEVTSEQASRFSLNDYYKISLPYSDIDTVTAQLTGINEGVDETRSLLIFRCSYMVSSLSTVRRQPMSIEMSSATGLEVRSDCIVTKKLYKYVEITSSSDVSSSDLSKGGRYIRTVSENDIKNESDLERQEKLRLEKIAEMRKNGEDASELENYQPKMYAEYEKDCTGVYIAWGDEAKFRRVDVIYSKDGISICRENNEPDGYVLYRSEKQRMLSFGQQVGWLKQYDEVITRTKGIHDGQIIKIK